MMEENDYNIASRSCWKVTLTGSETVASDDGTCGSQQRYKDIHVLTNLDVHQGGRFIGRSGNNRCSAKRIFARMGREGLDALG